MLTTHVEEADRRTLPVDRETPKSIAPVFWVPKFDEVFGALLRRGVKFAGKPREMEIGKIVKLLDPNGHMFFLYEPSEIALAWPSGRKINQILEKYANQPHQ